MKRMSYREPDYAFGQRMLTLRMATGLTQAALAELLGVARHTVGAWESGESYPKAERLKAFIALALQQHVFLAGNEAEEIRVLWRAAHQKVPLDELWLQVLLRKPALPLMPGPVEQTRDPDALSTTSAGGEPQVDWGDALDVPSFYGREEELALLTHWVGEQRCRVVSVLGMGGIGKSALATKVMQQVAGQFEVVIWRSLRDAPTCDGLVDDCLQVLTPQSLRTLSGSLEGRLHLLMEQFRARRVLLVFDNLEMLLGEGEDTGHMRAGFEGYVRLLQQMGETAHQSCLLLTSREMLVPLLPLEGRRSPVRTLRMVGLEAETGTQLLEEKDVTGLMDERARLVEVYQGNPLALKIVAHTIVDLFGGQIAPFLQQGEIIFGGVRHLLDEQFERLSALEQTVLLWLAILREPVSLHDLLAVLSILRTAVQVLEAVEGLRRRSLIEQGQRAGSFTLQSVVLEYATSRLIAEASREIEQGQLLRLVEHGLSLAQAKEYVRQVQEQLLVAPLLTLLRGTSQGHANVEARLLWLLDQLRDRDPVAQGYGPANLVTLLRVLRGHLRNLDLSHLSLRGVFLRGVKMQDTTLSHATMQGNVFTESLDALLAVAISRTGASWATGDSRGEIRVWEEDGRMLRSAWHAHTEMVWTLAFSPDARLLASASANGNIKLWEVGSGRVLWESWHAQSLIRLAFSPDGGVLASGELDALVRFWDSQHGTLLAELQHTSAVFSLAWSSYGGLLASGCLDGSIWLWRALKSAPGARRIRVLAAHTHRVMGLAFSPDGTHLASASFDGTVKLWNLTTGACLQTFSEHTDLVVQVLWSPDGGTLASCSFDATIRLWDLQQGRASKVLQGHTGAITSLAFTPDSRTLLSSSYDGTLRVWDVQSGKSLRILGGYTASLLDLDWSPDGRQLASYGADTQVTVWDVNSGVPQSVVQEHRDMVQGQGVAWSPDGRLLASGGRGGIELWDPVTGIRLHEVQDPDAVDTVFQGVAWSPDGRLLAAGSYVGGVQVWEMTTRRRRWMAHTYSTRIRRVACSPDGRLLAGGGYDGVVYVWDASEETQQLVGHDAPVMCVAWSPDGRRLASGGRDREGGQLLVWEMHTGQRVHTLTGPFSVISAVVWNLVGSSSSVETVMAGCAGGRLRAESASGCKRAIRGWCKHSRSVPMAAGSRVAVMMGRFGCGTCAMANCSERCGETGPTSGSISRVFRVFPRHKRRRYTPWGRSRTKVLVVNQYSCW